ncbi:Uncharacterised protein [Mycobacteroides abscessus]|nr:Uncharacterised protein [Mycobacteroides abscessus]SKU37011.1 Uncharacterised protein [Mycobacteroides abscessus subsp. abscessus]
MTQPVVELQAVQQYRPVGQAKNVAGQQVAVPVDDSPVGHTLREQHRATGDELGRKRSDQPHIVRRQYRSRVFLQGGQGVVPSIDDGIQGSGFVDRRTAVGTFVKSRQHLRDRIQVCLGHPLGLGHRRQPRGVRVTPHHHDRLTGSAVGVGQMRDTEIAVLRDAAVQGHLTGTRPFAKLGSAEVQEVRDDGLLDLIGHPSDQNHDARVSFAYLRANGGGA